MRTLDTYIGIEPFTVLVDESQELTQLVSRARELRNLHFPEKLVAVKKLVLGAMINAYEAMLQPRTVIDEYEVLDRHKKTVTTVQSGEDNSAEIDKYRKIVMPNANEPNLPLSGALKEKAGCCRYQGALFFVLGYEANLGDRHFLHVAPMDPKAAEIHGIQKVAKTVFNEIFDGNSRHPVSIFRESLKNPRNDYARKNPRLFDNPLVELLGFTFYSYHQTPAGLTLVANPNGHRLQI